MRFISSIETWEVSPPGLVRGEKSHASTGQQIDIMLRVHELLEVLFKVLLVDPTVNAATSLLLSASG